MKTLQNFACAAIAVASIFTAAATTAAPVVFFGENQNPAGTVSGAPVTARGNFLSTLAGVSTEKFESFNIGTGTPLGLGFAGSNGTINATLTGAGNINNTTINGRFNTSAGGSKYYEVSGNFTINFDQGISAFGFYGTDIGDFSGRVTLGLAGGGTTNLIVPNTINGANGSLLFFGFIDPTVSYTSITFGNTNSGTDVFGFDDMIIGDRAQVIVDVPEPGSAALLAIALLGLGVATRRKQKN